MVIRDFRKLREIAGNGRKRTAAVAAAHDGHTLEAVFRAADEGLLDYVLVGDAAKIRQIAAAQNHALSDEAVIDCESDEEAAREAVCLIRTGEADFLQKGLLQTGTLLKKVLDRECGIGTGALMSHVALLDIAAYHKIVGVTDGGMLLYPDLEQKKGIVRNAAAMFAGFGYEQMKAAALCAVETVNPKMPETLDAAALKEAAARGELGRCLLEGPISMDLAVSRASAQIKGYDSPICGDADLLLVPDIVSGNLMVKALLAFGETKMAGCVVGAKCPIALNSRSASFEEKYDSLLACACMLRAQETGGERETEQEEIG